MHIYVSTYIAFSQCLFDIHDWTYVKAESYTGDSNSRKISKEIRNYLRRNANRNTINNNFSIRAASTRQAPWFVVEECARNVPEVLVLPHELQTHGRNGERVWWDGERGELGYVARRYAILARSRRGRFSASFSLEFRRNSSWHNIRLDCCSNRIFSYPREKVPLKNYGNICTNVNPFVQRFFQQYHRPKTTTYEFTIPELYRGVIFSMAKERRSVFAPNTVARFRISFPK